MKCTYYTKQLSRKPFNFESMTFDMAMAVPAGLVRVLLSSDRQSFPSIPIRGTDLSSITNLTQDSSKPK